MFLNFRSFPPGGFGGPNGPGYLCGEEVSRIWTPALFKTEDVFFVEYNRGVVFLIARLEVPKAKIWEIPNFDGKGFKTDEINPPKKAKKFGGTLKGFQEPRVKF